jgi:hypothetical protein
MEMTMRILTATLCLLAAAAPADAISRYNTARMDYSEVKSRIGSEGAVILRFRSTFNPSIPRFGRYVAGTVFCDPDKVADFASVPTADTRSCPSGSARATIGTISSSCGGGTDA